MPVRRDHIELHQFTQTVLTEHVLYHRRFVHTVGYQYITAGLRNANGFAKGFELIFPRVKVIHRPQQHRHGERSVRKRGQIQGVPLHGGDRFGTVELGFQLFQIVSDQLHRGYTVSLPGQCDAVSSRSRSDLQNCRFGKLGQTRLDIFHGSKVFDLAVRGKKTPFFVILVVVILQIAHFFQLPSES